MKKFDCVKLNFISPLHLGRGIGETYDKAGNMLHSDTISAALASARVQLFGDKDINEFVESFRVSSAFPFYNEHYFLPKPMMKLDLNVIGIDEFIQNKFLKKIEYLEKSIFERIIAGEQVSVNIKQFSKNRKYLFADDCPIDNFIICEEHQRVTIPRDQQSESIPYYVERMFFYEGSGLFFLVDCSNEKYRNEIKSALKLLEDNGLGTDRSVGNGFFKSDVTEFNLSIPNIHKYTMTLSLFCPCKEELNGILGDDDVAYLLEKRGGFIAGSSCEEFRHLRKKSVFMFLEGSTFYGDNLIGKVVNLRPEWNDKKLHPVYRSGKPISIPVVKN